MIRIVLLAIIAILVTILLLRAMPRLRARVIALGRSPLVRYLLTNVVLRLIRLLIFRR